MKAYRIEEVLDPATNKRSQRWGYRVNKLVTPPSTFVVGTEAVLTFPSGDPLSLGTVISVETHDSEIILTTSEAIYTLRSYESKGLF